MQERKLDVYSQCHEFVDFAILTSMKSFLQKTVTSPNTQRHAMHEEVRLTIFLFLGERQRSHILQQNLSQALPGQLARLSSHTTKQRCQQMVDTSTKPPNS